MYFINLLIQYIKIYSISVEQHGPERPAELPGRGGGAGHAPLLGGGLGERIQAKHLPR